MHDTSARLLRLLALLQSRRDWNGPLLANELGVTTRTIRKDVERLRALGYPVHAAPGVAGGYRLGAGTSLPPLLLDDAEAVAVAIGLRSAGAAGVVGIQDASLSALRKLEQVLPARLHRRVSALHDSTVAASRGGPSVDAGTLTELASAIRDHQRIAFQYVGRSDERARRKVEPHRLIHTQGRWYLVAWDIDRSDWRTFRADRMTLSSHVGPRFTPRAGPESDLAAYVERGLAQASWRHRARVKVLAPAAQVIARVPPAVLVEPIDERTCHAIVGSDDPHQLALWLGLIDADFEAGTDSELAHELRQLAARFERAARPPDPSPTGISELP